MQFRAHGLAIPFDGCRMAERRFATRGFASECVDRVKARLNVGTPMDTQPEYLLAKMTDGRERSDIALFLTYYCAGSDLSAVDAQLSSMDRELRSHGPTLLEQMGIA